MLNGSEIKKAYLWAIEVLSTIPNGLLNSLTNYWKADTNGSYPDAHWSNNGTINWATYTSNWKINWWYSFDWVNDSITTSLNTSSDWDWTFSSWFKQDAATDNLDIIINKDRYGWFIRTHTDWKAYFYVYDWGWNSVATSASVADWNWHLICWVIRNNSYTELFLDWVSQWTNNIWTVRDAGNNFQIWAYGSDNYFWWMLDEQWLWNKALSTDEITALYNNWNGLSYNSFTN